MTTKCGQQEEFQRLAFASLSEYFQEHADEVIEIEILPPAIQPPDGITMQDGMSLGVPKKILALAYLEARQHFFVHSKARDPITAAQTLQATKVMLLFDPEHLTAANYRKRTLFQLQETHGLHVGTPYHRALRQELCFLNSILTSPLHRQSKSPTLWYHRSSIVDSLRLVELGDASQEQIATFWESEFAAIYKSGEQHPKNYHAWQYARKLVPKLEGSEMVVHVAHGVKEWCCRHPSDISGWSFLLYLMPIIATSLQRELVGDILNYAKSLDLEQESIWIFIRTVLALHNEEHSASYQLLESYREDLKDTNRRPIALDRVCNAIAWIQAHQESSV
ncbi:hypothetical protein J4E90_001980 [Alternaria incomplexa]|uniref:uncharacterized protein n=1 Tax=Alternaria metachromatica TaxID=283354 RepID=UPI0020C43F2E|nr:uncharacterized protein J4E83_003221 [Alternaria metachromatica]XP_049245114.1 uncharacterized protein J4E84_004738 [Alternaria hordeiaustralica]XP_051294698.1 uncharacterized protein J4E90_001980 [Alternaria incomplexa]KAI4628668.1 hypothetical protein J4E83_003221 [Alternaria metachromatica]KAI4688808.1 hypothetical protein J4E84_004738 [Alternaria hordeiaustralica]KAI4919843.1 hypothetical protein J4E90_001980 [Alternaria incomplexa]